ncbi:MAG: ketoacyl-ACP synthase III [Deltaproteobacteria bacterium]|nr:ketoacyl-ACP synthase III [Deltaproteobacteria bacterium]
MGMSVPDKVSTNDYFAAYLDTSDEWISERSGIKERRWAEGDIGISELSERAARQALANGGFTPQDIDGIVFATVTPDYAFPSSACLLQKRLGITQCFAFDLAAACSGFIYGLSVADGLIAAGRARNILVVGADVLSSLINKQDRSTCFLFGDGAGAAVLSSVSNNETGSKRYIEGNITELSGLYAIDMRSDGSLGGILTAGTGSALRASAERIAANEHCIKMDGREVFKFAVRALADVSLNVCQKTGINISEVTHFVSHQANMRILQGMAKQLGIPEERVPSNIARYGNTSAGTIPILLTEMIDLGRLKKGDLVLLSAVGAGITWGAILLRW